MKILWIELFRTGDFAVFFVQYEYIYCYNYKTAMQGTGHRRVPNSVGKNPIIIEHELCAGIIEVGRDNKTIIL